MAPPKKVKKYDSKSGNDRSGKNMIKKNCCLKILNEKLLKKGNAL